MQTTTQYERMTIQVPVVEAKRFRAVVKAWGLEIENNPSVEPMPDSRCAGLIDTDWREKPMRLWGDVHEELCKDLGEHYGLNDIREAL